MNRQLAANRSTIFELKGRGFSPSLPHFSRAFTFYGSGMVIAGTVIILGDNGKLCRAAVVFSVFFSAALAFDRDLWYNITVKLKCLFQAGVWA